MAHTKAKGATKLGRESQSKRLGIKKFGGQKVIAGNILIRQRGSKYRSGANTKYGKDYTIFATCDGIVQFSKKKIKKYTGKLEKTTFVEIISSKNQQLTKRTINK